MVIKVFLQYEDNITIYHSLQEILVNESLFAIVTYIEFSTNYHRGVWILHTKIHTQRSLVMAINYIYMPCIGAKSLYSKME